MLKSCSENLDLKTSKSATKLPCDSEFPSRESATSEYEYFAKMLRCPILSSIPAALIALYIKFNPPKGVIFF